MSDIVKRTAVCGDTVSVLDDNDPVSVASLVPEVMQSYIRAVPEEIWHMSVGELTKAAQPTVELRQLRIAFWLEYERAKRSGMAISLATVCRGIISRQRLQSNIMAHPASLAYLLTPPEDYRVKMEEMLTLALEEERKILELPLTKKKTSVDKDTGELIVQETNDTAVAAIKHKIRESLQNRLYGMPVARTHQVNVNKNVHSSDEVSPEDMSDDDLQKYIEELKRRQGVIDVGSGAKDGDGGSHG